MSESNVMNLERGGTTEILYNWDSSGGNLRRNSGG